MLSNALLFSKKAQRVPETTAAYDSYMVEDVLMFSSVKGQMLDVLLESGWYRMGKFMFTTQWLAAPGKTVFHRVFWLRYLVNQTQLSKSAKTICAKNAGFDVVIRPFRISEELKNLRARYISSISFETTESISDLLGGVRNNVFDTQLVEVRDNGRLIAAGIMDIGEHAVAGIANFFDPDYKKYSPGKFLIIVKYLYCMDRHFPYYYPGYFSPDYHAFDYKLFLDKNATEVMLPFNKTWVGFAQFSSSYLPDMR